jgi:hypothetical protein
VTTDSENLFGRVPPPQPAEQPAERHKLRIPIRPHLDAVLFLSLPMTDDDWEQFTAVLAAMKPGIVK